MKWKQIKKATEQLEYLWRSDKLLDEEIKFLESPEYFLWNKTLVEIINEIHERITNEKN